MVRTATTASSVVKPPEAHNGRGTVKQETNGATTSSTTSSSKRKSKKPVRANGGSAELSPNDDNRSPSISKPRGRGRPPKIKKSPDIVSSNPELEIVKQKSSLKRKSLTISTEEETQGVKEKNREKRRKTVGGSELKIPKQENCSLPEDDEGKPLERERFSTRNRCKQSCAVEACSNTDKCLNESSGEKITFFPLPTDRKTRTKWEEAVPELKYRLLPSQQVVCAEHFVNGSPTDAYPFPSLKLDSVIPQQKKTPAEKLEARKLAYRNKVLEENKQTLLNANLNALLPREDPPPPTPASTPSPFLSRIARAQLGSSSAKTDGSQTKTLQITGTTPLQRKSPVKLLPAGIRAVPVPWSDSGNKIVRIVTSSTGQGFLTANTTVVAASSQNTLGKGSASTSFQASSESPTTSSVGLVPKVRATTILRQSLPPTLSTIPLARPKQTFVPHTSSEKIVQQRPSASSRVCVDKPDLKICCTKCSRDFPQLKGSLGRMESRLDSMISMVKTIFQKQFGHEPSFLHNLPTTTRMENYADRPLPSRTSAPSAPAYNITKTYTPKAQQEVVTGKGPADLILDSQRQAAEEDHLFCAEQGKFCTGSSKTGATLCQKRKQLHDALEALGSRADFNSCPESKERSKSSESDPLVSSNTDKSESKPTTPSASTPKPLYRILLKKGGSAVTSVDPNAKFRVIKKVSQDQINTLLLNKQNDKDDKDIKPFVYSMKPTSSTTPIITKTTPRNTSVSPKKKQEMNNNRKKETLKLKSSPKPQKHYLNNAIARCILLSPGDSVDVSKVNENGPLWMRKAPTEQINHTVQLLEKQGLLKGSEDEENIYMKADPTTIQADEKLSCNLDSYGLLMANYETKFNMPSPSKQKKAL